MHNTRKGLVFTQNLFLVFISGLKMKSQISLISFRIFCFRKQFGVPII